MKAIQARLIRYRNAAIPVAAVVALAGWMGACSDGGTEPPAAEGPTLLATVRALDGGSVDGLSATWTSTTTGASSSGPVGADGRIEFRLPDAAGIGELVIDGPEPRAYHPFMFPVAVTRYTL